MPVLISVEGNVGCGKTTLLRHLQAALLPLMPSVVFVREPVDVWMGVRDPSDGVSIMEKYYRDRSKYALGFQVMARVSRTRSADSSSLRIKFIHSPASTDSTMLPSASTLPARSS